MIIFFTHCKVWYSYIYFFPSNSGGVSVLQAEKATESQYQSGDHKYQEGHRFVVWEGDKNTRPSLHHYKVLVSKSFLQAEKATKRKSVGGNKVVFTRAEHSQRTSIRRQLGSQLYQISQTYRQEPQTKSKGIYLVGETVNK